ncbi:hypothetical protein N8150_02810 [Gammaproteobacteria bacterium]|nr:hypothetical protein [Gammaproteobacteria bacterium]
MKKLLFLILLTPFAYADMDYICAVATAKLDEAYIKKSITDKNCKRNMIFSYTVISSNNLSPNLRISFQNALLDISNKWCRFDRNRDFTDISFSCVLYADKPRKLKTR